MTFLKALGQAILKGAAIVGGFAPLVEAAVPGQAAKIQVVSNDFTQMANLVVQVEAIGQAAGLTGAQRASGIAGAMAQTILQTAPFLGKKIANPVKFQEDSGKLAGVIADLLNDVDGGEVKTQSVT